MKYILTIGDLLTRPKLLSFVEHIGVVVGPNTVFHNTPEKGEHVTTVQEFSAGKQIRVLPTGANPVMVMNRAQKALANPKRYDPLWHNCEHSAYEVVKGIAKSPQLIAAFVILALLAALWLVSRR